MWARERALAMAHLAATILFRFVPGGSELRQNDGGAGGRPGIPAGRRDARAQADVELPFG